MKHARPFARSKAELRRLEVRADHAGLALACVFSSAAEFEADVIRTRREAGLIGGRHVAHARSILVISATAALAVLLVIMA